MLRLTILMLCCADLAWPNAIHNCECWDGYKVEYNKSGSQCVGVNLFHIMPCNMAKAPKCQCSGIVSSILKDRTGTWCTRYSNGVELTRWPCENAQEWEEFFKKYPHFI
ncbi:uncharacterized protein LOC123012215 [Tribolium madens]|uniref:uncharacterized protein LOC123012215 n=1 Tax=Tribolium madens TaxID=41895 RepID=UPI001CF7323C|nr:uncharacterized protein LOC123012215 [Tribolium madens]